MASDQAGLRFLAMGRARGGGKGGGGIFTAFVGREEV